MNSFYIGLPFNLGSAYIEWNDTSSGWSCEVHPRDVEVWAGRLHVYLGGPDRIVHDPSSALERMEEADLIDFDHDEAMPGVYKFSFEDPSKRLILDDLTEDGEGRVMRGMEVLFAGSMMVAVLAQIKHVRSEGVTLSPTRVQPEKPAEVEPEEEPEDPTANTAASTPEADTRDRHSLPWADGVHDTVEPDIQIMKAAFSRGPLGSAPETTPEPTEVERVATSVIPLDVSPLFDVGRFTQPEPAVLQGTCGNDRLVLGQEVSNAVVRGGHGFDTLVVEGEVSAVRVLENEDGSVSIAFLRDTDDDPSTAHEWTQTMLTSIERIEVDGQLFTVEELSSMNHTPLIGVNLLHELCDIVI